VSVVRPATRDDEAALVKIDDLTVSWQNSPAKHVPGSPFFNARTTPDQVWVAVEDGVVAGYVKLRPPTPLPSNAHILEVQGLAVHPSFQRRGLARTLLSAAIAEAERRGAKQLRLRVLGSNAAARALYASCGFDVVGVLPGEFLLDGRYVDDVIMSRAL
jgi:ribosomal protein S18 acetylase RimI-like enzyme